MSQTPETTVSAADEARFRELVADYPQMSLAVEQVGVAALHVIRSGREIGIDEGEIWATVAIHAARAMQLDLGVHSGRTAACLVATLLMQQAG